MLVWLVVVVVVVVVVALMDGVAAALGCKELVPLKFKVLLAF